MKGLYHCNQEGKCIQNRRCYWSNCRHFDTASRGSGRFLPSSFYLESNNHLQAELRADTTICRLHHDQRVTSSVIGKLHQ